MESLEHNRACTFTTICDNRLIFGKWEFLNLLFLNIPTSPIISQISI